LLGIAFHPEFGVAGSPNRGYVFIHYSYSPSPNYNPGARSDSVPSYNRLARFTVPDSSLVADRNSELVLINQYDRHLWHSGGALCFDTDGYLYVSCGDEGGNNDPYAHGGKINLGFFCGAAHRRGPEGQPQPSHSPSAAERRDSAERLARDLHAELHHS